MFNGMDGVWVVRVFDTARVRFGRAWSLELENTAKPWFSGGVVFYYCCGCTPTSAPWYKGPLLWRRRQDGEYVRTRRGIDGCCSGEPAESRQHCIILSEIEAGKAKGLLTHAADPDAGVDMA